MQENQLCNTADVSGYNMGVEKTSKILLPLSFFNEFNKIVEHTVESSLKEASKMEDLWSIKIKPKFEKGINDGDFLIKSGSLEIRNAQTGKFVGKAELEKVDFENIVDKKSLSKLSASIVNITGQWQLADISRKLDVIKEEVTWIKEFLWREKIAELQSLQSTIQEAIESLPNSHALDRINDCIKDLKKLSELFKAELEALINKNIKYSLFNNVIESFIIWKYKKILKSEYDEKYTNDVFSLIQEYYYLIELYCNTCLFIAACYQLTNEYHHVEKYYLNIEREERDFSNRFANKLAFLFEINDLDSDTIDLSNVLTKMRNNNLPDRIFSNIQSIILRSNQIKLLPIQFSEEFEKLQIEYKTNFKLESEEVNDD